MPLLQSRMLAYNTGCYSYNPGCYSYNPRLIDVTSAWNSPPLWCKRGAVIKLVVALPSSDSVLPSLLFTRARNLAQLEGLYRLATKDFIQQETKDAFAPWKKNCAIPCPLCFSGPPNAPSVVTILYETLICTGWVFTQGGHLHRVLYLALTQSRQWLASYRVSYGSCLSMVHVSSAMPQLFWSMEREGRTTSSITEMKPRYTTSYKWWRTQIIFFVQTRWFVMVCGTDKPAFVYIHVQHQLLPHSLHHGGVSHSPLMSLC